MGRGSRPIGFSPWRVALMLVLLGATAPGLSSAAESGARSAAAEKLFKDAIALATQGEFQQAVEKFKASQQLDPSRGTLLGLAMAEERAGMLATALGHYQDLLHQASKAGDTARGDQARQGIERVKPEVPDLTIASSEPMPEGAELLLDQVSLPLGAVGSPLPVDPGDHRVEAHAPAHKPFSATVHVERGSHETIEIALAPLPAGGASTTNPAVPGGDRGAESGSSSTTRTLGYVSTGVGAIALATGVVLLVKSDNLYGETQQACPNNTCTAERRDDVEHGQSLQHWGNGLLVVGGALAATGVTLLLWPRAKTSDESSERGGTARLVVGPTGAQLHGTF